MGNTVDELVIRIRADASQLERELKRLGTITQQETRKMGGEFGFLKQQIMGLVPALSAAALVTFAKRSIEAAGRMKDLGDQIGFSASTLSALETGLVTTGSSVEQFATAVNLMNANIGQAASGNEQMAESFSRLGLSVDGLKKLSPEQQFYAIADALAQVGTQYEQTEIGRAIFGRGFANIIPLIKEANGNLEESIRKLQLMKEGLSEETIDRIDAFGDALQSAGIKARNAFLEAFAAVLQVIDAIPNPISLGEQIGGVVRDVTGMGPKQNGPEAYAAKAKAGGFVTEATFQHPPPATTRRASTTKAAASSTRDLSAAQKSLNDEMQRAQQITERMLTPEERHNQNIAEAARLFNDGLITLETYTRVQEEMSDGMEKVGEQSVISARLLKDSFADALESAMFDFENFGDSVSGVLEGIARDIARKRTIGPLSDSVGGILDGAIGGIFGGEQYGPNLPGSGGGFLSDIGDFFGGFFADGGTLKPGQWGIAGENGPEPIFAGAAPLTVYPTGSGGGGGTSVTVVQHNSFGSGVTRAEVANMLPALAAATKQAVFEDIQRGGRSAQIVGRRN